MVSLVACRTASSSGTQGIDFSTGVSSFPDLVELTTISCSSSRLTSSRILIQPLLGHFSLLRYLGWDSIPRHRQSYSCTGLYDTRHDRGILLTCFPWFISSFVFPLRSVVPDDDILVIVMGKKVVKAVVLLFKHTFWNPSWAHWSTFFQFWWLIFDKTISTYFRIVMDLIALATFWYLVIPGHSWFQLLRTEMRFLKAYSLDQTKYKILHTPFPWTTYKPQRDLVICPFSIMCARKNVLSFFLRVFAIFWVLFVV